MALSDPAVLLYTSGTTGLMKGALLSHGNLTWNAVNLLAHLDIAHDERTLCVAPVFHAVGLSLLTLPTLFKGGTVNAMRKFDGASVLATIQRERITAFAAVPTMLQMMCEDPSWADTDLSSLAIVVHGGAPMPPDVAAAWMERGVPLFHGYGMTEASPGISMAPPESDTAAWTGSVGSPHFFTDVAVCGPDGAPGPPSPGARGELVVRGPHVVAEYWNRPEETARSLASGTWFRTGDLVTIGDTPAQTHIVDRVKDLIITGGENVAPSEVEAVALALDAVEEIVVVAVPDARWGEVGAAFVKARPGLDPVETATAIRAGRASLGAVQGAPLPLVRRGPPPHQHRQISSCGTKGGCDRQAAWGRRSGRWRRSMTIAVDGDADLSAPASSAERLLPKSDGHSEWVVGDPDLHMNIPLSCFPMRARADQLRSGPSGTPRLCFWILALRPRRRR